RQRVAGAAVSARYTLAEIARAVGAEVPARGGDTVVTGYSLDSRSIQAGELFVAVVGERFDGRAYVKGALERGAAGALVGREGGLNGAAAVEAGVAQGVAADAPVVRVADG